MPLAHGLNFFVELLSCPYQRFSPRALLDAYASVPHRVGAAAAFDNVFPTLGARCGATRAGSVRVAGVESMWNPIEIAAGRWRLGEAPSDEQNRPLPDDAVIGNLPGADA